MNRTNCLGVVSRTIIGALFVVFKNCLENMAHDALYAVGHTGLNVK